MIASKLLLAAGALALAAILPARANVITDWDERAVAVITPKSNPPQATRAAAIVHVAMFEAVNSIAPRYRPYKASVPATPDASQEAAAAAAASGVLAAMFPEAASDLRGALTSYLAAIPDGPAKTAGLQVGEAAAAKIWEARANDGAAKPDAYRPKAKPGIYVPTPITVASMWPQLTPFVMTKPSQFRPAAPPALKSAEWAASLNEVKDYGGKNSTRRSAQQTENGRFWIITGPQSYTPILRQIVQEKQMSVVDSARFMALAVMAGADAIIAVMDAKYRYELWRPITAIRNAEFDGNPATAPDATWQPIDNTPMHPEYPCAHCINSAAIASAVEAMLGSADIPEVSMTSATAPGVTHRWTNLRAWSNEVSEARIWAGFHYRFSTVVGQEMGRKIGAHTVKNALLPAS